MNDANPLGTGAKPSTTLDAESPRAVRPRRQGRCRLPRAFGGNRKRIVLRLVCWGLLHSALVFIVARHLRHAFGESTSPLHPPANAVVLLILVSSLLVLRGIEARDAELLGQDFVIAVRRRVLRSLASSMPKRDRAPGWGATLNRLSGDLNSLKNWVSLGLARMITSGVSMAGLFVVLFRLDGIAAAWVLVSVLATWGFVWGASPFCREALRRLRLSRGRLANRVGDFLLAGPGPRHLGRVTHWIDAIVRQSRVVQQDQVRRTVRATLLRRSPELAHGIAISGLLGLPICESLVKGGGTGTVAAVLFTLGMITSSLAEMVRGWDYRMQFEEGRRRLSRLLRMGRVAADRPGMDLPGEGPVALWLDGVRWANDLSAVTFRAEAGARVLLSGPAGSGKSSVCRLIASLGEPHSGEIRIDGVPLAEVRHPHRVVQLVSSDVPLWRGTVRENIDGRSDGMPLARREAILHALGMQAASMMFPAGPDTPVHENGVNLSSSAQARVRLARALFREPRLLVIDEPVLLVDEAAHRDLFRALELTRATVVVAGPGLVPLLNPTVIWRLSGPAEEDCPFRLVSREALPWRPLRPTPLPSPGNL